MVWHFLQGSKRWFVLSIVFACLTSVLDLLNPKIISYTVDSVIDSKKPALTGPARALIESCGGAEGLRNHLWLVAAAVCAVALRSNSCLAMLLSRPLAFSGFARSLMTSIRISVPISGA